MQNVKKICCRITPRRLMGAVLLAATVVNLIIVGAAFEVTFPDAVPTVTVTQTTHPATMTFFAPTATDGVIPTITLAPTDTPTSTATFTPTDTPTWTPTDTPSPSPTVCAPQYSWPTYMVQSGDTLSELAVATGSSTPELMRANCLLDSRIYVGQLLYVPRLPIVTATYTPSFTATYTPTGTPPSITPSVTASYTPATPPILLGLVQ